MASTPTSQLFSAKLHPPRPSARAVLRSHLVEPLLAALPSGLILVTAPAGFGKTTLMGQIHDWMSAAGMPTGWLSLEPADNDFGRFVAYVRAALARVLGREALDGGASPDRADSPLAQAMELSEFVSANNEPFALFLDDLGEIHNQDILAFVSRLVSILGQEQRLIVGARQLPMLDIHRLRAYGKAVELDARKLRFSLDETRDFLRRARLDALTDADVLFLHERTEGWAAALQLATLALASGHERPQAMLEATLSAEEVADYLSHEVFSSQPGEIKDFLLKISILPTFCAELCDAVCGRSDSREMIRRVEDANLFLAPLDGKKQWYRFHRMFAEFLRQQFERSAESRMPEPHRRAALWLRDDGRSDRAVEHALRAQDKALAAAIMNDAAAGFLAAGRVETLAQWAGLVPIDLIVRHPELHSACTTALINLHRHEEAGRLIAQLLVNPGAPDEPRTASMLVLQTFLVAWSERLDEIEVSLQRVRPHEARLDPYRLWAMRNCAAYVLLLHDDLVGARRLWVAARGELHKTGGRSAMVYSDAGVAMCDLLEGQVRGATVYLERALEAWEPYGERFCTSNTIIAALLAEAKYAVDAITASRELLDIFLPLIRYGGFPEVLISSMRVRARIAAMDGEPDRASELLNELESLGEQRKLARVSASAWLEKSRLALAAGNSGAARRHLEMATMADCWGRPEFASTYANDIETPDIGLLRCQIADREVAPALARSRELLAEARGTRRVMRALKLKILHAQALWVASRQEESLSLMREALSEAAADRLVRTFADEPWVLSSILRAITAAPGTLPAGFLDELSAACRLDTPGPQAAQRTAPAGGGVLSLREIEVLQMVAGGLSNKEIARQLFRSEATVATHLRNIYSKLEANGRMQAILFARQRGLLA